LDISSASTNKSCLISFNVPNIRLIRARALIETYLYNYRALYITPHHSNYIHKNVQIVLA